MRNDHKAAKKRAEKIIAMFNGEMFNRDNIVLAACYLELLELAKVQPVAWATNGYGKISLYWREGLVIDFIPNGRTIGLYASPPVQSDMVVKDAERSSFIEMLEVYLVDGRPRLAVRGYPGGPEWYGSATEAIDAAIAASQEKP